MPVFSSREYEKASKLVKRVSIDSQAIMQIDLLACACFSCSSVLTKTGDEIEFSGALLGAGKGRAGLWVTTGSGSSCGMILT